MIHLTMVPGYTWTDIFGAQVGLAGTQIDTLCSIYLNCISKVFIALVGHHPLAPGCTWTDRSGTWTDKMMPRQIL